MRESKNASFFIGNEQVLLQFTSSAISIFFSHFKKR